MMKNGTLVVMINKKLKIKIKIYLMLLLINLITKSEQKKAKILKKLDQMLSVEIKDLLQFKMLQSKYFSQTSKYKSAKKKRRITRKMTIKIHGKMKNLKVGKKMNKLCQSRQ